MASRFEFRPPLRPQNKRCSWGSLHSHTLGIECRALFDSVEQAPVPARRPTHRLDEEADAFARQILLPAGYWEAFLLSHRYTKRAVCDFAERIGVSPGIVAGQLVREGRISPRNQLNRLLTPLHWPEHLQDRLPAVQHT